MKWLIAVLVCVAFVLIFGTMGDDDFTGSDWDEFHDWCVERPGPAFDCGVMTDVVEKLVNDHGLNEDCVIRNAKRGAEAPTKSAIDDAMSALEKCPR